jgi:hypothetical protein
MKFGRKPRIHDPRVPQMKVVTKDKLLAPPPPSVDYAANMPANLGVMLNDQLGDCTAAAVGHAIQTWSFNADGKMITPTNGQILKLYEATSGYIPGQPNTDNGAIEQEVLTYWLNNHVDCNELAAFIEVDVANTDDVKRTIYDCGLIYIGFNVPAYINETPGSVWDIDPNGDNTIIGGHAVVLLGYDTRGNYVVESWGSLYTMTLAFFTTWVDECYALANKAWIKSTGKTPAGLSLANLEALMQEMKSSPTASNRRRHRHHRRIKRKHSH